MTSDERADDELLSQSRLDPDALGVLYERHAPAIYKYLLRRAGAATAEDLLGEVFVAALTARMRVVPHVSGSALPWLYGIAGNVLRVHLRRRQHSGVGERDHAVDWDAIDARLDASTRRQELRAALACLTDGERELLLLVAWEGLSPAEAADALGLTPVAARSRLHRARARAQASLNTVGCPAT